jgi:hypothetical protein
MILRKDSSGRVIGYRETYFSEKQSVSVSAIGRLNTITTTDRTTGQVEIRTVFGQVVLPTLQGKWGR